MFILKCICLPNGYHLIIRTIIIPYIILYNGITYNKIKSVSYYYIMYQIVPCYDLPIKIHF